MKRQVILIVSLVAGLLAAILTRVYISVKDAEVSHEKAKLWKRFESIEVLAVRKDVPAGTILSDSDLEAVRAPKLGLRGHAIERIHLKDVRGRRMVQSREAGDVLFWSDVEGGAPALQGLSADIKRKMRAMSVNVSGAAAVSGMIKPNDHVDVIGTFNFPGDDGKIKRGDLVTCTILQNVLVLATGKTTAKSQVRDLGIGGGFSMVTLEVTPREAEVLAFAEQIKGRLILTLRNRSDTSTEKELPNVDFEKIRSEIETLNQKRQFEKLSSGGH